MNRTQMPVAIVNPPYEPTIILGRSLVYWCTSVNDIEKLFALADDADALVRDSGYQLIQWDKRELARIGKVYGPLTERDTFLRLKIRLDCGKSAILKRAGLTWDKDDQLSGYDAVLFERLKGASNWVGSLIALTARQFN